MIVARTELYLSPVLQKVVVLLGLAAGAGVDLRRGSEAMATVKKALFVKTISKFNMRIAQTQKDTHTVARRRRINRNGSKNTMSSMIKCNSLCI